MGFGAVCPHPRRARARARRMKTESTSANDAAALISFVPRLPAQPKTERAVDLRPIGGAAGERVERVHRAARRLAAFYHDLEQRQVERQVEEHVRARQLL